MLYNALREERHRFRFKSRSRRGKEYFRRVNRRTGHLIPIAFAPRQFRGGWAPLQLKDLSPAETWRPLSAINRECTISMVRLMFET